MTEPSRDADSSAPQHVEFRCTNCQTPLRVPVEVAGRTARCPSCQSVQTVPSLPPAGPPASTTESAAATTPVAPSSRSPTSPQTVPASWSGDDGTTKSPAAASSSAPPPGASRVESAAPRVSPPTQPGGERPTVGTDLQRMLATRDQYESRETPTRQLFEKIVAEIGKVYVGQDELVLGTLVALFSSGHVLIESVPGLGKTLFVRTLGRVLGCDFGRIQFTADLMPSDITGAPIFNIKEQEFRFRPGPVFTQFLLADEINRAPAKTHAALLEIMQEYRVTVDGTSHRLTQPFLVIATQNPIESEGTYNLPEAQLDRFMFKLVADYPAEAEEARILELHSQQVDLNQRLNDELETVASAEQIVEITRQNADVRVDPRLVQYINRLVRLTREWPLFHLGASPRAGLAMMQAARTLAAFCGRDYAVPDDVVQIALPVLRHRVILTAEAEVEEQRVDDVLTEMIRSVEVPRI